MSKSSTNTIQGEKDWEKRFDEKFPKLPMRENNDTILFLIRVKDFLRQEISQAEARAEKKAGIVLQSVIESTRDAVIKYQKLSTEKEHHDR